MEPMLSDAELHMRLEKSPAPRVTEESIKAKIAKVEFLTHGLMTICIIRLTNGWLTTGVSAPASVENFNPAIGERTAYDNAFKTIWPLEGYLLRETLHRAATQQDT